MTRTVLLLDDDESFRHLVANALSAAGLEVVQASKARDAREILSASKIDLAIVDGLLPDENGFEVIASLRAGGNEMPVVFVSAFWRDIDSYRKLTRDLGVSLVMHKPLDAGRLADRVAVLLRKRAPKSSEPRLTLPYASPVLVREYAEALPQRLGELHDELLRLRANEGDQPIRQAVRRLAHRLRGTGGSYGFEDVATVAGRIEDAISFARSPPADIEDEVAALAKKHENAGQEEPEILLPQVVDRPLVLVVDDDTMFLEDVVDLAEAQLLDLQVASGIPDALKHAASALPSAAFVGMPLGEPDESLTLVRTLRDNHPSLPVAVIGLEDSIDVRAEALAAGAELFLSHPLSAEGMAEAVGRLRRRDPAAPDALPVLAVTEDRVLTGRLGNIEAEGIALTICAAAEVFRAMDRDRPDVVLVDVKVGGYDGTALCRIIRATLRHAEVPVLIFGADGGPQELHDALGAGADGVLSKLDVVTAWAEQVHVAAAAAHRRHSPSFDPVTRLRGRARSLQALSIKLAESRRHARPFMLALIDVDGLVEITYAHGRSAGDRILAAIASALRSRFRSEDVRGRLGPDELVMGFADADDEVANILARVRDSFSGLSLVAPSGERYNATFSIGVAHFPGDGDTIPDLITAAERRLSADRERS